MAAQPAGGQKPQKPFHIVTPVLESLSLSKAAGTKVFMKMENVQPSGSFKIRGIGHLCQAAARKGCRHFVCSSGGNAGLAAALAARELAVPITVVVPSSSGPTAVHKLQELGATVEVYGKVWDDANSRAQELAKTEGWVIIPPFDHPLVWGAPRLHPQLLPPSRDPGEPPGWILPSLPLQGGSRQPGPGAEGLSGGQARRHRGGGGWRGAAGWGGGRPAAGGLAGCPRHRRRDAGRSQLPRGAQGRPARHPARHHQRGHLPGSQDGGGAGAGMCPGVPGDLAGGAGRGGREGCAAVPGRGAGAGGAGVRSPPGRAVLGAAAAAAERGAAAEPAAPRAARGVRRQQHPHGRAAGPAEPAGAALTPGRARLALPARFPSRRTEIKLGNAGLLMQLFTARSAHAGRGKLRHGGGACAEGRLEPPTHPIFPLGRARYSPVSLSPPSPGCSSPPQLANAPSLTNYCATVFMHYYCNDY